MLKHTCQIKIYVIQHVHADWALQSLLKSPHTLSESCDQIATTQTANSFLDVCIIFEYFYLRQGQLKCCVQHNFVMTLVLFHSTRQDLWGACMLIKTEQFENSANTKSKIFCLIFSFVHKWFWNCYMKILVTDFNQGQTFTRRYLTE